MPFLNYPLPFYKSVSRLSFLLIFLSTSDMVLAQSARQVIPNTYFRKLLLHHDTLWATSSEGIYRHPLPYGDWHIYNTQNSQLPTNDQYSIAKDSMGRFWTGGFTSWSTSGPNALAVFQGLDWSSSVTPLNPGVETNQSYRMACDTGGTMFCSFWYHNVGRYHPTTGWSLLGSPGGARTDQCSHLFFDKLNRLWIGTNQGLWRMSGPNTATEIRRYHPNPTPDNTWINYVYDNLPAGPGQDSMLLATQVGLLKGQINDNSFRTVITRPMLKAQLPALDTTSWGFEALARDTNGVLFLALANANHLVVMGCGETKLIQVPYVQDIVVDKHNVKWLSSLSGLYLIKDVMAVFNSPRKACTGTQVQFSDSSFYICKPIVSRRWFYGDGDSGTTATHIYRQGGQFTVTLIVSNQAGLTDTATQTIDVTPRSTVQIAGGRLVPICNGARTNLVAHATPYSPANEFRWRKELPNGTWAEQSSDSTLQGAGPGLYVVILNVGSPCPQTDTIRVIEANEPIPSFSPEDGRTNGFCPGGSVTLVSGMNADPVPPGYRLQWLFNFDSLAGDTGRTLPVTRPGSYTLRYTTPLGCTGYAYPLLHDSAFFGTLPVHEWAAPAITLDAINDTILCGRDSTLLFADLGASGGAEAGLYWFRNGISLPPTPRQLFLTAREPGLYKVMIRNRKGCIAQDSMTVLRPAPPNPVLSWPDKICQGDTAFVTISKTQGLPITWATTWLQPGRGAAFTVRDSIQGITGPATVVVSISGCEGYTSPAMVVAPANELLDCPQPIYPNVLTPDGDGLNERFFIKNLRPGTTMKAYNRWGTQVYTSPAYTNDWAPATSGIYFVDVRMPGFPRYRGWVEVVK